ncbi:MAG: sodium:calcium antiporter, partial [Gammaproteobacteria bacterium]
MSALQNAPHLAYSNVVGSNLPNIVLVLAVSAVIAPVTMQG